MKTWLTTAAVILSVGHLSPAFGDENIVIKPRQISNFEIGSDTKKFGRFEFIGGLAFSSENELVGAVSGIRLFQNRKNFIAVADTGHWFSGQILRDDKGAPSGITSAEIAPIRDKAGNASGVKWEFDAEGVALRGDKVFVSFERNARVDGYQLENVLTSSVVQSLPVHIPAYEFRANGGLEALAVAPLDSPLNGAMVTLSERSVDKADNLFAAVLDGPKAGVFTVKRDDPFSITDADFLPNGDLLLLERRFNIASGVGMRLRLIKGEDIKKGALVDGEVLLDVGNGYQIDNMEGLSINENDQGEIFVTLISDDNHSFLQRNLLLEFKFLSE